MPDAMVSAAGLRVVKLLVGTPPQTVSDLIEATGVTRTAVTEQLNELVAAGYLQRTTEKLPGRGRPRYLYAATDAALVLLFADNQRMVVPTIWKAIDEIGGNELARKVIRRSARALANYYKLRVTAKNPTDRLRQLIDLLRDEGALIEITEEEGNLVIYKRSCPFISMFEDKRSICCVDQEMLSSVVGRPVRRTASRHDGAPCCTFALAQK
jgi:predicted ArsR family transcriptional regulator